MPAKLISGLTAASGAELDLSSLLELQVPAATLTRKLTITQLLDILTPASNRYQRTTGNYTTTSATFVDVDGTNLDLAITLRAARRVMVGLVGAGTHGTASTNTYLDVAIDGVRQGLNRGLTYYTQHNIGFANNVSFTYLSGILTAAEHHFKLQWATNGGTATLYGGTGTELPLTFWVQEMF